MTQSFLHTKCRAGMCDDCVQIAEEFEELLKLRTNALIVAEHKREQAEQELAILKRRAAMYEEVAKAGVGDIIGAWMDKEIGQLLKKLEAA